MNASDPLVSVIIPTYNRPDFLERAVCSVLSQSFQDFEILVVNDAGEDVRHVVDKFTGARPLLYLVHDVNKGLAASRNTGLRQARGKYVAYLDDDDIFYPPHLASLVEFLEQSEFQVAYTDAYRAWQVEENGKLVTTKKDTPYSLDFDPDRLLFSNYIPVLCVMHHRSCLDRTGLFDESLRVLEDLDLWIRMSRIYPFAHIAQLTCEFSWRETGDTMSNHQERFAETLAVIYRKYELNRKEAQARYRIQELERLLRERTAKLDQFEVHLEHWVGKARRLESEVLEWADRTKTFQVHLEHWVAKAKSLEEELQALRQQVASRTETGE